jgi:hypothetical protein
MYRFSFKYPGLSGLSMRFSEVLSAMQRSNLRSQQSLKVAESALPAFNEIAISPANQQEQRQYCGGIGAHAQVAKKAVGTAQISAASEDHSRPTDNRPQPSGIAL